MTSILSIATVYQGWTTLRKARLRFPDGSEADREIEDHGTAVAILPYDPLRRTVIMVRLPRAPLLYAAGEPASLEACAGLIDKGESAAEAAGREAMEEMGVRLAALEFVANTWVMPGISTERMALYLARYGAADQTGQGGGLPGEHENIEVVEMPAKTLWAMAADGTLADLKTLSLVQALKLRHPAVCD